MGRVEWCEVLKSDKREEKKVFAIDERGKQRLFGIEERKGWENAKCFHEWDSRTAATSHNNNNNNNKK